MKMLPATLSIRLLIIPFILLLCACGSPYAPDALGPWAVGHGTFTAVDENRGDRSLKVNVWYPVDSADAAEGPLAVYPLLGAFGVLADVAVEGLPVSAELERKLLVFSHGYGGPNTQSTPLMEALASHGFIVVAVEHTGNTVNGDSDPFEVAAANRVPDVSFIIDTMLERSATIDDDFYGRIDVDEVGVLGHSFGGSTALGTVMGGFGGASPDPRVKAIAPVSGVVSSTFTDEQLAGVNVPVLLLGGTLDTSVPLSNNEQAFAQMPATVAPVFKVDIIGATHTHFANVCAIADFLFGLGLDIDQWGGLGAGALVGPYLDTCTPEAFPIEKVVRLQNLYMVAFFQTYLNGLISYNYYLTEPYSANEPDVIFSKKGEFVIRENEEGVFVIAPKT